MEKDEITKEEAYKISEILQKLRAKYDPNDEWKKILEELPSPKDLKN
jgi:hypothetical protein